MCSYTAHGVAPDHRSPLFDPPKTYQRTKYLIDTVSKELMLTTLQGLPLASRPLVKTGTAVLMEEGVLALQRSMPFLVGLKFQSRKADPF
jgi:hypothetical protein